MFIIDHLTKIQLHYLLDHTAKATAIGKNPVIDGVAHRHCIALILDDNTDLLVRCNPTNNHYFTEIINGNPNYKAVGFESSTILGSIANVTQVKG